MAGQDETHEGDERRVRVPVMQQLLDDPYLLVFLGVALPTVLYLMWGVMEIAQIPIAP